MFSFEFKKFVIKKIEKLKEKLTVKLNLKIEISQNFSNKIKQALNGFYKNTAFKSLIDENSNFSREFFDEI